MILLGKSFDTSCPLGPWLTTKDEVGDPQNLKMQLRLNGELRQDANTNDMIYGVRDLVSWWSLRADDPRCHARRSHRPPLQQRRYSVAGRGVHGGVDRVARVTRGLDLEQPANLCSTGFRDPNEGCGAPAAPLLGRTDKEFVMRKMIVTCAGAAALFAATAFAPPLAQAMTIAAPAGLAKAAQAANLTEDVAYVCRAGWRWRRCWWTPGYAYYRPYYYRPAYRA